MKQQFYDALDGGNIEFTFVDASKNNRFKCQRSSDALLFEDTSYMYVKDDLVYVNGDFLEIKIRDYQSPFRFLSSSQNITHLICSGPCKIDVSSCVVSYVTLNNAVLSSPIEVSNHQHDTQSNEDLSKILVKDTLTFRVSDNTKYEMVKYQIAKAPNNLCVINYGSNCSLRNLPITGINSLKLYNDGATDNQGFFCHFADIFNIDDVMKPNVITSEHNFAFRQMSASFLRAPEIGILIESLSEHETIYEFAARLIEQLPDYDTNMIA